MSRPRRPAHIRKWRGKYYLMYFDHLTGKERRLSCESLDAFTPEQRKELVYDYQSREESDRAEVRQRGGRLAYDTPLVSALQSFLDHVEERAEARKANAEAREGLSVGGAAMYRMDVKRFKTWLEASKWKNATTGELDRAKLSAYLNHFAKEEPGRETGSERRSGATLNAARRSLKACLNYLNGIRPPLFPDFDHIKQALKPVPTDMAAPVAFSPDVLKKFLKEAVKREAPDRKVIVERKKRGRTEKFEQTEPASSATPVSKLFVLLALTGMRLGEALTLKWKEVDLDRGRLTIFAPKTGRRRILPLVGAPEGEIAPKFLEELRRWRREDPNREFVLPHNHLAAPVFPKTAWEATRKLAKLSDVGPQALRQNFTSYAASLGIPSAVCALWQGHSTAVAERYYRAQVLERAGDKSIEDAVGLTGAFQRRVRVPE